MLIPSERHRPEDLELWAELEEADSVRGVNKRKVDQSIAEIMSFARNGSCYAGWSGGKDSTVLAHLISRAGVNVPLLYVRGVPVANPEILTVRDFLLPMIPGVHYHEKEIRYANVFMDGRTNAEDTKRFFAAFREMGTRHISGIRADESGGRKIRMRQHGLTSKNACAPLGWWTGDDCFAYLAAYGLPVHPSYAMLGAGRWERKHLRVDELGGSGGNAYGRSEWEREYYGDVLNWLASR